VTSEPTLAETGITPNTSATTGMTTKVVKGSFWTLAGQMLPMAASLFTTPFVIRFLGSEQYGVYILVGLIPGYFAFADLGMGFASTKFASEAYGEGNAQRESESVLTAAIIALISSAIIALPLFLFSSSIVSLLNVTDHLQPAASTALKITSISFVLVILSSVLNTPQLSRLRMDLNSTAAMLPRVFFMIVTPILLYFGFGLVAAVTSLFLAALTSLLAHIYLSGKLQPQLFHARWNSSLARPLFRFASGWLSASIAAIVLMNTEKLALTKLVSVQSLAYYSVAFMFANMGTLFSGAMLQSLLPAFSQLQRPERISEYKALFTKSMRFNIVWLLPALAILIVSARPFFTFWAGEEYGNESTMPFYILIAGLLFNILAFVPHSTILAAGRTSALAKLYWLELVIYVPLVMCLIYFFGILGAAAAWSARVAFDMFLIIWLARRNAGVTFEFFTHVSSLIFGAAFLAIPVSVALVYDSFSLLLIPATLISIAAYGTVAWAKFLESAEREQIRGFLKRLRYRFAF
jgi:O-antigen/teichoic acid export membrane protein